MRRQRKQGQYCQHMITVVLIFLPSYYLWISFISPIIVSMERTSKTDIVQETIINETENLIKQIKCLAPNKQDLRYVKRILLVTTFRSGSTFLGDLLQHSYPLTYYHYEPLHSLALTTRITPAQFPEAENIIRNLFQCEFRKLPSYMQYITKPDNSFMIINNKFLFDLCNITYNLRVNCSHVRLFEEACFRSQVQIMKVNRLYLKDVLRLELPVNTKIIYLQRDPRAIYSSRKRLEWCQRTPCLNISLLCHERRSDLLTLNKPQSNKVILVRFEDLALNPVNETKRLLYELGLQYTDEAKSFIETHTTNSNAIYDPLSTKRNSSSVVSAWKTKLSKEDIIKIQEQCADVLKHYEYEIMFSK